MLTTIGTAGAMPDDLIKENGIRISSYPARQIQKYLYHHE